MLKTIIQVILILILARMVFFWAYLLQKQKIKTNKTKRTIKQNGSNLVPTYNIFVAFSLYTSQNKLKTKGSEEQRQKSKNNILESHYARKRPGKKTSHSKNGKIFRRWQKWPFCKGYSDAKSSRMTYLGDEFRWPRIIQKVTVNTQKRCFMRKTAWRAT